MTNETRNVDLVIRAENKSKRTLDEIRKELEAVNKAIEEQVAAADKGGGSLKELEGNYRRLEEAMKALLSQQALIKTFEAQKAQLVALQNQLGAASKRLREFQEQMAGGESTKKQEAAQARLIKSIERSETAVAKQSERLAGTRKEAEALGIDLNNLAQSQDRLLASSRNLATVNATLGDAIDTYATRVKLAANAEKQLAETRAFDQKAAEAAKLVKASEYAQFWITELEKIDAAERKLADTRALNLAADRAVAAARGYTTLADASKRLVQNARPLSEALKAIADPSAATRGTLAGIEEQVQATAAALAAARGPVQDYREQMRQLAATQDAIARQGASIDAYVKQIAVLRQARAAFAEARAELLQHAAAMRSADAPTAEMIATQKRLEASLAQTSAQFQQELARSRELREGLRAAGVETNSLAASQTRLVAAAKTTVTSMTTLTASFKKYGAAANEAGNSSNFFEENGRTTLSFMQRLRGEVLALAAAYVGLQGTINLATGSLDAFSTKQGILNQLALSTGNDPRAIGEAFEYIRGQADRIGISFEDAAKGFAKFSAAASLAGRSQQEIRFIFETFSEVGRVAQLSADDLNGVFKALEQVISKGKIQAEELRGQLGDRLFGAFEIAAKALKDQFPDLDKAMKDGLITADQLVRIAEQYKKTVAEQLPGAMQSLSADQARLNSALFEFKTLIAESGFADTYARLIDRLLEFFRSDEGTKFAQDISKAFSAVTEVLIFLLDHLDEVKLAVELAFGLKAAQLVAGFATNIAAMIPKLIQMNAAMAAGTLQVGRLQKAFLGLAAFFVGWEIGTYLSDQFEIVRQAGISLVAGLMKVFAQLEFAAKAVWVGVSEGAKNAFKKVMNEILDLKDGILRTLADLAEKVGQTDLAATISSGISKGMRGGMSDVRGEVGKLQKQLEADLKKIDEIAFEMFQDASDAARKRAADAANRKPTSAGATPRPDIAPVTPAAEDDDKAKKAYEKLVKQRVTLAEQLQNQLTAIEAKIAKNEKLSLEDRLRAIDLEAQKVFNSIAKLAKLPGGEQTAAAMKTTLDGYVKALKAQETLKFNAEELTRREKALNEQIALRAQLLESIKVQQEAGLLTELQAKEKIAEVDERMVPAIQAAADASIQWAEANAKLFDSPAAMETYIEKMKAIKTGVVAVKDELLSTAQANELLATLGTSAFDSFAKSIAEGATAIDAFRTAFLQFAADFLKQIALMIIKQILLNALQNSSIGGALSGAVNGAVKHDGGLVGRGGTGRNRDVPSSWFATAPRYHSGGVVGLAPNEVPAILQRNEEVLAADDPRNVLNGGGGAPAKAQDIKIINAIDSASVVTEGLSTSEGTKAILNVLRANRSQVKQLVG